MTLGIEDMASISEAANVKGKKIVHKFFSSNLICYSIACNIFVYKSSLLYKHEQSETL